MRIFTRAVSIVTTLVFSSFSFLLFAPAYAAGAPATGDEFVGLFPSWANVKTVYGAKGDGVADDTAALQAALNDVGQSGKSSVLYLPAGTYRITSTLNLTARGYIGIVGEDPATTIIKWAGPSGGTMLSVAGVKYSRFDRLTFDGATTAGINVNQSWDGSIGFFDTGNQYADDVFKDAGIGIQGGAAGHGFAETSVLRSHFLRNTTAGIFLGNFNALDLWVWYSTFDNCGAGIANRTPSTNGAGNWRVYNSIFRNSTVADNEIGNLGDGAFSMRNNYSIGSRRFIEATGYNNPANLTIQGNTILDTTDPSSISVFNQGPVLAYDNVIRSNSSVTEGAVVSVNSWSSSDMVAVGNTFTVTTPLFAKGRLDEIDSSIVSRSSINPPEPTLPGTPPNLHRQIFEVPVGANAAAIQQTINNAATQNGNRPIVHFPAGVYSIASTITIPANTDIQLVGDASGDSGGSTRLTWSGNGTGPVVYLPGPTKATLRDLTIDGSFLGVQGLVADNIDQQGSVVYMQGVLTAYGSQTNLLVNGLDYTDVEAHDLITEYQSSYPGSAGVRVIGGPLAAAGTPQTGKVNIYSGLAIVEMLPWDVLNGASLLARDVWTEGGHSSTYLHVPGLGMTTLEGFRVALDLSPSTPPAFDIKNAIGKVSLLGITTEGKIVISGDGSKAQVLALGLVEEDASAVATNSYFFNNATPPATAGLLEARGVSATPGARTEPLPNQGTIDNAFVKSMMAQTRAEMPRPLATTPAGATDLRLYRVTIDNSTNNLVLSPGTGTPPRRSIPSK